MIQNRQSPFSFLVANQIKAMLNAGDIRIRPSSKLIFLCGAHADQRPNARADFLVYAERHLKGKHFFLAESVFGEFEGRHDLDLLTIEQQLADYSDCILIMLESDGAKVELGAFSAHEKMLKKLMVVNDRRFQEERSFISMGPLAKVAKKSIFKKVYHADLNAVASVYGEIEEALKIIESKYRRSLGIQNYAELKEKPQRRLFLLADLIWLFSPISHANFIHLLKFIFGRHSYDFIKYDIAFLKAMKWVVVQEDASSGMRYYLAGPRGYEPFCDFDTSTEGEALRSLSLQHTHKHKVKGYSMLKEYAHGLD
jgi:hypothetical protein